MEDLKKRKTPRYQNFDYSSIGVYFITVCTKNRRPILSRIVGTGVLDCPSETGVHCSPQIELTRYGKIADRYIKQINAFYDHLSVESYVIMPNHIHFLLWVKGNKNAVENGRSGTPVTDGQSRTPVPTGVEGTNNVCPKGNAVENGRSGTPVTDGQSRTPVPTGVERANSVCAQFVSTFKRFCNKEYGENIWQGRYYDHIIRSREDCEEHKKYIYENPIRWYYDELYSE